MNALEVGAIVVGGGIAGLAAALELQGSVTEVFLIDASDRPGGMLRTDHVSGFVVERGPNTLQLREPASGFFSSLGQSEHLIEATPASRDRFLFRAGALERVPLSLGGLLRSPLLSREAKWRLLREPFVRRGDPSGESVADFAARRFGSEVVEAFVGPFLTGIYAGDERELGVEAVFGALAEFERRYGSVAFGALWSALLRRRRGGSRGVFSAVNGLGPFARRLSEQLIEAPALESEVLSLHREQGQWFVRMVGPGGGRALRSRRLVIATPAREAARLLEGVCQSASEGLAEIRYAPVVSIGLGIKPADAARELAGFGFLVPRGAGLDLLGCLFMSQLFPRRAPKGSELLQCLVGGARWPEAVDLPDDLLVRRVQRDLERAIGLRGDPQLLAVSRWPRAVPQPDRHHLQRVARIRAAVRAMPGLALAGSYLDGVGVPDALASGLRAGRDAHASAL
jgi:oxygen-dependent protoporphyrinogen oxidase